MANGVQLATAYISLNVRTEGIKRQVESALAGAGSSGRQAGTAIGSNIISGIREHMSGGKVGAIFAPIAVTGVRWAASTGKAIGTALRTAIVSSISLGVGAALLGATAALTAGLDRLKTIQRAQVQLSLTLPPQEIKRVTKDIQDVVKGTPIALDEALQAVPRALSAGIKPGKELNQYIQNIADAAASSGGQAGFGQIDIIFSQILGKGKLMGEELMQLTENGVDLRNALKNTFNWDDKKLNSMVAKGKVGMKEIQQAVEATWGKDGGLSKQMGNTFDGAMGNLKASVARLGANVLGLIFGDPNNPDDPLRGAIDGVTTFTQKIDAMGKWVADNRENIRGYFTGAKDTATSFIGKVKEVVDWFKRMWQGAQDFGSKVGGAFDKAKDAIGRVKTSLTSIFDDVKKKFDSVFGPDGWFAKQFDRLAGIVDKVRDVLGLGPATANAATTPTNTGPSAPSALPGGGMRGSFGGSGGSGMSTSGQLSTGGGGGVVGPFPIAEFGKTGKAGASAAMPGGGVIKSAGTPYGLPAGTDTGGYGNPAAQKIFPPWVFQLGERFGVKPSTYSGHQEGTGTNRGIDWVGTVEQMQAFADALIKLNPPGLEQVIWQNPNTGKRVGKDPGDRGKDQSIDDYYRDDWAGHMDHVHTRFSQNLDLSGFASGGGVWGAGTGTSDSIPAMLSNGEHVLTAADVKKMGGQQGVYAFRQMLQAGMIPGFAPGGAVDPSVVDSAQNNLADLNNQYQVLQAQLNEAIQSGEATPSQMLDLQNKLDKTKRDLNNAAADLPIIMGGGTPPDRSKQNRVYDVTDELEMLQQQLADQKEAGQEIPYSQQLQQNYQLESLKKERGQAIADLQGTGQGKDYGAEFVRSLGFIPASAGSTSVAGTSSLAGFIDMGNSVVSGVIDTGVNLANQAVSAAITAGVAAGSFGGASAAAPLASMAASYGIQLAGNQAKRISSYWFGLAGIGADALQEQLFPFGSPRWLGYDYGNFAPQIGIQDAALGTLEAMGSDAIAKHFAGQAGQGNIPADPTAGTNTAPSGPSTGSMQMTAPGAVAKAQVGAPNTLNNQGQFNLDPFSLNNPNGAGGAGGGGSWAKGGAVGIYDNGGVLKPGQLAFNASRTPESILTKQQWNAMAANASTRAKDSAPLVQNLYAQDMQDAIRQLEKVKRRDMMQYAGRP